MITVKLSDNVSLIKGDAYEVLPTLKEKSVDLIHTDPPYLIHSGTNIGKFMESRGVKSQQQKLIKADISDGFDYSIFDDFKRVCKTINYQIWCNKKQFIDYLIMAKENKWNWQDIHLFRNNPLPNVRGKYVDSDYLVHLWKGRTLTGAYKDKFTNYSWNIGGKKVWNHPALKPVEPIEHLLQVGSNDGDVVLDPFMGSGSTAIACINTNRGFIGIEKDEEFFNMAVVRITELLNGKN